MSPPPPHTLILLRHGKSAYPAGVPDHARPLAERGRRQAALAGEHIRALLSPGDPAIDLVLCSTAERTRQTLAASGLDAGTTVEYRDEVYGAESDELLDLIAALPEPAATVLVVGHFPGLPDLAEDLAGPGSDPAALTALTRKFPTSAFAVLTVDGPWSAVPAGGRLVAVTIPRDHPAQESR